MIGWAIRFMITWRYQNPFMVSCIKGIYPEKMYGWTSEIAVNVTFWGMMMMMNQNIK